MIGKNNIKNIHKRYIYIYIERNFLKMKNLHNFFFILLIFLLYAFLYAFVVLSHYYKQ